MGNEQSNQGILKECSIDDNPIVQNGTKWSLHHAQLLKPPNPMSVFIGDDNSSLENFAKVIDLLHTHTYMYVSQTKNTFLFQFSEPKALSSS